MKLKLIFLGVIFATVFFSCKKDEPSISIIANAGVPLLSKVLVDNQPFYEYLYTNTNLVSEEKSKLDYTIHTYNDKNQLLSTDYYGNNDILSSDPTVCETALNRKEWLTPDNNNKVGTLRYEYNSNGQMIKTTYTRPLSGSSEYSEIIYDANNRISRQMLYWENNKTGYTDYSYDGKGNLTKESLYILTPEGVAELSSTTAYEFDNAQNPYESFSVSMTPGINTNRNNITKETYTINTNVSQGPATVQVTEALYAYNGKGYPVSKNNNVAYVYK